MTAGPPPSAAAESPNAPAEPSFATLVWAAATRPSAAALVGTLLVAASLLMLCIGLLTPQRVALIDPRYLMIDEDDDYAAVTVRALALAAQQPKPLCVVILGASSMREAIWGEAEMEAHLTELVGQPVRVLNLSAVGQSLWEMGAIADAVSQDFRGVIAFTCGPLVFSSSEGRIGDLAARPRLGFTTDAFDAEVQRAGDPLPRRSGVYFLDNFAFFAARLGSVARLITGPVDIATHRSLNSGPDKPDRLAAKLARHGEQLADYDQVSDDRVVALRRTLERIERKAQRVELVLVEGPRNPRYADQVYTPPMFEQHAQRMRRLAADVGGSYFDLNDAAALTPDDFRDFVHLQSEASMRRFTHELAVRLAPLLRSVASPPPAGDPAPGAAP